MIDETAAKIEAMHTHSSSTVATEAAQALTELLDREYATVDEFHRDLEHNTGALRRANPSHASLETAMTEIEVAIRDADVTDVAAAKEVLKSAIETVTEDIESGKQEAAENAAAELADGDTILTHDYSSTVLGAIESATDAGKSLSVYVTEARPRFLGRKTARTLANMNEVEVTLIVDSAAGTYLTECDHVLTGMTCVVDDTLYNRVGTHNLASVAAQQDVPFSVVGSSAKVLSGGFIFENAYRSETEVMREPADGFAIENPAYDSTPLSLVDHLITDDGVEEPDGG